MLIESLWSQFQFWLWKWILGLTDGLPKWRPLPSAGWPRPFPVSLWGGPCPTSIADSDHRFPFFPQRTLLMRSIKGHAGWKLIHDLVNLWLMRPIAKSKAPYWFCRMDWKLTFISPSPLASSGPVYPQRSTCLTQLHSKIINFYFLLHPVMILYHTYEEWTNWCLYLAQKLWSRLDVSFSEAVNFICSRFEMLAHRSDFLRKSGILSK